MSKIQSNGYGGETLKEALLGEYSDTYKDVAGFRPRPSAETVASWTEDHIRGLIDGLYADMASELRREADDKAAHEAAVARYTGTSSFPPNTSLAEALASVQETDLVWGDFEAAEWDENGQPRSDFDLLVFVG